MVNRSHDVELTTKEINLILEGLKEEEEKRRIRVKSWGAAYMQKVLNEERLEIIRLQNKLEVAKK